MIFISCVVDKALSNCTLLTFGTLKLLTYEGGIFLVPSF
jgi:hypothetical protein